MFDNSPQLRRVVGDNHRPSCSLPGNATGAALDGGGTGDGRTLAGGDTNRAAMLLDVHRGEVLGMDL